MRLVVFGERIPASDAAIGGISDVVTQGTSLARARELLTEGGGADRKAVRASKELLRELLDGRFDGSEWTARARELSASAERLAAIREVKEGRSE
jgi:hypothetical protein